MGKKNKANSDLTIDTLISKNQAILNKHNEEDQTQFNEIAALLRQFAYALKARREKSTTISVPPAGASLSEIENYQAQIDLLKSEAANREQLNQDFLMVTHLLMQEKSPLNDGIKNEIAILKDSIKFATAVVLNDSPSEQDINDFRTTADKITERSNQLEPSNKRRTMWSRIIIGLGVLLITVSVIASIVLAPIIGPAVLPLIMGGLLGGVALIMTGLLYSSAKSREHYMHDRISGIYQNVNSLFEKSQKSQEESKNEIKRSPPTK